LRQKQRTLRLRAKDLLKNMKMKVLFVLTLLAASLMVAHSSWGQDQQSLSPAKRQFVTAAPVGAVAVSSGHPAPVTFTFHIQPGYHINSNKPLMPELIPTQLKFSLPGSDMVIGRVKYPDGQLMSFAFDPNQKLSVYSGDFSVKAVVVAPPSANSGSYTVHADLKYQACDNNACYPPKNVPVAFDVKVGSSAKSSHRAHPSASSPHIHN
jgi:Thiol:disulfide interchange protein DsbD, N-terminal